MPNSRSVGKIILCILVASLLSACSTGAGNPPAVVPPAIQPTSAPPAAPATPAPQLPAPTTQPDAAATATPATSAGVSGGEGTRRPLSVVIYSPLDGAVVDTADIALVGEADPNTVISINDDIVLVGPDRKFSDALKLEEGPNVIEITASDEAGNQGTIYLTVFYDTQS